MICTKNTNRKIINYPNFPTYRDSPRPRTSPPILTAIFPGPLELFPVCFLKTTVPETIPPRGVVS
jgi:hypothetical protein